MRQSNRFIIGLYSVLCILYSPATLAWDYKSTGSTTEQTVQMRVGANFTKKWRNGVRLSVSEELRFNLYDIEKGVLAKESTPVDTTYGASFNRSYTTLAIAYAHPYFTYLKLDAGYTLLPADKPSWLPPAVRLAR